MSNKCFGGQCDAHTGRRVMIGAVEGTVVNEGGYTGHVLWVRMGRSGAWVSMSCERVTEVIGQEHGHETFAQRLGCNCKVCRYDMAVQVF